MRSAQELLKGLRVTLMLLAVNGSHSNWEFENLSASFDFFIYQTHDLGGVTDST